jgi:hypothetical protein
MPVNFKHDIGDTRRLLPPPEERRGARVVNVFSRPSPLVTYSHECRRPPLFSGL